MLRRLIALSPLTIALAMLASAGANAAQSSNTPSTKDILAASSPAEWRTLDQSNLMYMQLPEGHRVVIELAPQWAPAHVANIKTMLGEHYFDNTAVYRVQDNFVTQWGDPDGDDPKNAKSMGTAKMHLPAEFTRPLDASLHFTALADGDLYAPEVGFVDSMPAARDPKTDSAWLVQCYGMVGVARDTDPTTGNGNTLYVPIGQAPRQIDRQLSVVGRVVEGMQWLSSLPRGPEPMGMYIDAKMRTPISSVRLGSALPAAQRMHLQVLRSDSKSFARLVESKRNRHDDFYTQPVGHIGICSVPLPVREAK